MKGEEIVIKGIQKNMVVVKNTGSRIFEEAYFILREKADSSGKKQDMVTEANRIIAANTLSPEKALTARRERKKERRRRLLFFFLGILAGAAASATLFFLL